jgi:hypothetical protein
MTHTHIHARTESERARERESERARERESERARGRESERASEQESERAREQESERVRNMDKTMLNTTHPRRLYPAVGRLWPIPGPPTWLEGKRPVEHWQISCPKVDQNLDFLLGSTGSFN